MYFFYKLWKLWGLWIRLFRLVSRKYTFPLTNSYNINIKDKPTRILTWNTQGVFFHINKQRINNIITSIKSFNVVDIICLQEVFDNTCKERLIYELKYIYPYYLLGNINKRYIVGEDSGLLILSRYPIQFEKEVILDEYIFPDRMANKSILYFKVGCLNLVTGHLQSNNMFDNTDISTRQIKMIKEKSPFSSYIITGDLNHNDTHHILNVPKNNFTRTWGSHDILDYIIPINYNHITLNVSVIDIDITTISDHYPLQAELKYKV